MTKIYQEAQKFLDEHKIDPLSGLTDPQVTTQRQKFGSNEVDLPEPEAWWKMLLEKFTENPMPILIAAAVVSTVLSVMQNHFPLEGIAILVAIVLATGVGFINEYKSGMEYEKLKLSRLDIPMTVIRNGRETKIQVSEIVVGDIVDLQTGTKIPADGILLHSESMAVDQSRFNGESVPAGKDAEDIILYGGTDVVAGTGQQIITKVGNDSEWGKIAKALASEEQEKTPLEERLDELTALINKVGTGAAISIFAILIIELLVKVFVVGSNMGDFTPAQFGANAATLDQFVRFFIIAVTIVVVAVPEGLPMAVNVSLALSMKKIAEDNNLVRKLKATETIGSANVILSDKTGTLTQNRMTITEVFLGGQRYVGEQVQQLQKHPLYRLTELNSAVNSTAVLIQKDGKTSSDGNSTEGALLMWVTNLGTDYRKLRAEVNLVKRLPFDAETKRMLSVVKDKGKTWVLVKGAPERVMALCDSIEMPSGPERLANHRAVVEQELEHKTSQAMRTLALAYKELTPEQANQLGSANKDELTKLLDHSLILLGIVGITDPMRLDVPEAIQIAKGAGIDVKMVTGDNIQTARVLSQQLGLLEADSIVMEGGKFRAMSDADLIKDLHRIKVLARAEPLDKLRFVNLCKSQRLVVAVTGDGTNDAPALKAADVGLSMGLSGTEVAKEASDIVLLDDNFKSIMKAVHWGRTLYENIQKFIQFQLTINFSALTTAFLSPFLTVFLEPMFGIKLLDVPLTVIQLLWINLIMDTLAVLALCLEPPSDDTMTRKPIGREAPFITKIMWQNIIGMGSYFTIMVLIMMLTGFFGFYPDIESGEFSAAIFTSYVFFQVFNLFNARSLHLTKSPFDGLSKSRNFLGIVALIVVVQIAVTTFGGEVFRTQPLSLRTWGFVIALTSTVLIFGEVARRIRLASYKG